MNFEPVRPVCYNGNMSKIIDKSAELDELTKAGPESQDPAYLAWVAGKVEQGRQDLADPAKRHSEAEIWKEHGFED